MHESAVANQVALPTERFVLLHKIDRRVHRTAACTETCKTAVHQALTVFVALARYSER
jgi:hypothetical protein